VSISSAVGGYRAKERTLYHSLLGFLGLLRLLRFRTWYLRIFPVHLILLMKHPVSLSLNRCLLSLFIHKPLMIINLLQFTVLIPIFNLNSTTTSSVGQINFTRLPTENNQALWTAYGGRCLLVPRVKFELEKLFSGKASASDSNEFEEYIYRSLSASRSCRRPFPSSK